MYGRNIVVRAVTASDVGKIVAWRNDPAVYQGFIEYSPLSSEEQLRFLESLGVAQGRLLWMVDWIGNDVATPVAVGMIGLMRLDMRNRQCELGPVLVGEEAYRRRGAGLEAEYLALRYAFDHLGMHKVVARVTESNKRVLAFHSKVGFRVEHVLRDEIFKAGRFESVYLLSMLEGEFRAGSRTE